MGLVKERAVARAQRLTTGIETWVDREVAGCEFKDERLGRRFCKLLAQIGSDMGQSIPLVCQDWANTKAAYRFFSNERVDEADTISIGTAFSAGVASAAFSAVKKVGFLTIRAICDFADGKKNDMWQEYAAYSAASCLRSFIESRPVSLSEGAWPKSVASVAATKSRISIAQRKKLFDELCTAFDMEEFKNLCFLLGVDIDEIPGDRKSARVRELILLFERRDTLHVLEEAVDERTR
ncbi:hypothetical protein ABIF38_001155 [Bradyrhizobium japonicum]|jgi:Transposase DNA-binding/Effector-associated domain 7|uniref:Uncharacterized protein n=1 Tax=Bradyrhizobium elkanii TaxID=29448 RepID=A0A4Y3ZNL3_BRAEL|nr:MULTISPECIES: transposase DNA-binding-containing protein [Bradyrhizobium]MBP1291814.1 hypothetical protein [Bradyrhizobium elkanii]MCP1736526.1 hypothetical protein [Bradyrhizobium elkanii]MCS3474737.1 hypothetical protein [Bradyrhizobium elkanii]MCS3520735.1 hypothetical protein [Bradyrhizobium elkanii]MCS3571867.1 hypothetical protein [Bradyrhizobium elkanii]